MRKYINLMTWMFPIAVIVVCIAIWMFVFSAKSFTVTGEALDAGKQELESQARLIAGKNVELIKLESKLDALRKQEAGLLQQAENARALIDGAETSIQKEAKIKGEAKAQILKAESLINSQKEAETSLTKLQASINRLQKQEADLQKSVTLQTAEVLRLSKQKDKILALNTDIESLAAKKLFIEDDIKGQQLKLESLGKKKSGLVAEIKTLTSNLNIIKKELTTTRASYDQVNKLKALIEVYRQKEGDLKDSSAALAKSFNEEKARGTVLRKALNDELSKLGYQTAELKTKAEVIQKKVLNKTEEHSKLSTLVAQLKGEEKALKQTLSGLKDQVSPVSKIKDKSLSSEEPEPRSVPVTQQTKEVK